MARVPPGTVQSAITPGGWILPCSLLPAHSSFFAPVLPLAHCLSQEKASSPSLTVEFKEMNRLVEKSDMPWSYLREIVTQRLYPKQGKGNRTILFCSLRMLNQPILWSYSLLQVPVFSVPWKSLIQVFSLSPRVELES